MAGPTNNELERNYGSGRAATERDGIIETVRSKNRNWRVFKSNCYGGGNLRLAVPGSINLSLGNCAYDALLVAGGRIAMDSEMQNGTGREQSQQQDKNHHQPRHCGFEAAHASS